MSNEITHQQIVIDVDVWHPFAKEATKELDKLIMDIRTRALLAHCGNVKLNVSQI